MPSESTKSDKTGLKHSLHIDETKFFCIVGHSNLDITPVNITINREHQLVMSSVDTLVFKRSLDIDFYRSFCVEGHSDIGL